MPRLLLAAAASMLLVMAGSAAPVAAPPNIIVVLIDDMGWGDFSSFGNREARTGHIDRLAAEGRRFESFYVTADRSPSRRRFQRPDPELAHRPYLATEAEERAGCQGSIGGADDAARSQSTGYRRLFAVH